MGLLVEGEWRDRWYDTNKTDGTFVRQDAAFRNWVTADGSSGFKAGSGRYHLFVAAACPWAHRTLIFRVLKGLTDHISTTLVDPLMLENGWEFGADGDGGMGVRYLYEVYRQAKSDYSGRVTVPVLWDRRGATIVSNESAEIIRMFNSAFSAIGGRQRDYNPPELRADIDAVNERVYHTVNNGVYKCGFATTQAAYEAAFVDLFDTLDWLEQRLESRRYLVGDRITEADWRLFTTLVRFDPVYVGHFKCNLRRIADYPNLSGYLRELYQVPGIAQTTDFESIKTHYHASHETINPTRIIPKGPLIDLDRPHGRDRLPAAV